MAPSSPVAPVPALGAAMAELPRHTDGDGRWAASSDIDDTGSTRVDH